MYPLPRQAELQATVTVEVQIRCLCPDCAVDIDAPSWIASAATCRRSPFSSRPRPARTRRRRVAVRGCREVGLDSMVRHRDRADVELAAEIGVDYLAVSFARSADDMNETRALLRKHGSGAGVIAIADSRFMTPRPEFWVSQVSSSPATTSRR